MHIILVSNRLATAKTITMTPARWVGLFVGTVVTVITLAYTFSWLGVQFKLPFVSELILSIQKEEQRKTQEYLRDNISSISVKVGEMQAKLMHLDILGERVAKQTGISVPKSEIQAKPQGTKGGAGGPLLVLSETMSIEALQNEIDRLSGVVRQYDEQLTMLESQVMERRIKATFLPTLLPMEYSHFGSAFGARVDPIAGVTAMHEGIDLSADVGTRVIAAAGGVVSIAEYHNAYGYYVEIDHGNDFSSRYAHLSDIDVNVGQLVKRGQLIARSGNTGRSTGPHLHFEVRYRGVPQNPARFLQMGGQKVPDDKLLTRELAAAR